MRRRPGLGALCIALAATGVGLYLHQTTFSGLFCSNYRRGCIARGGDGYSVLLAVLVPALVLTLLGAKLIWDQHRAIVRSLVAPSPAPTAVQHARAEHEQMVPEHEDVTVIATRPARRRHRVSRPGDRVTLTNSRPRRRARATCPAVLAAGSSQ